jgi:hypothetical protein
MIYDYENWLSTNLLIAPDPDQLWLSAFISETGLYVTNHIGEYTDLLDQRGEINSSFIVHPGLSGSRVDAASNTTIIRENRSYKIAPYARLRAQYIAGGVYVSDTRHIADTADEYHLPEYGYNTTNHSLQIYANGRMLMPATDADLQWHVPEYTVKRNQGSPMIAFETTAYIPEQPHYTLTSKYVSRDTWTYYNNYELQEDFTLPLNVSFHWPSWIDEITSQRDIQRDMQSRCSLWVVVQRPDLDELLIEKLNDASWNIDDYDVALGNVHIQITQMHNYLSNPDLPSFVDILEDETVQPVAGCLIWFVLCDSLQTFNFVASVDATGKVVSLNLKDINNDYLQSNDKQRLADEIVKAGSCPFVPPPIKNLYDLDIYGHKLDVNGRAVDTRRLHYTEDWLTTGQSLVYYHPNTLPIHYASGGCIYTRIPLGVDTTFFVDTTNKAASPPRFDPITNWQNWSQRIYSANVFPDTENSGMLLTSTGPLPIHTQDSRSSMSCWINGLYREIEVLNDNPGRIGLLKDNSSADWCRYSVHCVVKPHVNVPWVAKVLTDLADPWTEWQYAIDTGAQELYYELKNNDADTFKPDNIPNNSPWVSLYGTAEPNPIQHSYMWIDPTRSGSNDVTVVCSIQLTSADYIAKCALEIYISIDNQPWQLLDTSPVTELAYTRNVNYIGGSNKLRFRYRICYLPLSRRIEPSLVNDSLALLTHPDSLLGRDYLPSETQILYWYRTTEYQLNSLPHEQYDIRMGVPIPKSPVRDTVLITWDRLTRIHIQPSITPNDPANGDYTTGRTLLLVIKDYYDHLDQLIDNPTDGPDSDASIVPAPLLVYDYPGIGLGVDEVSITPNYTTTLRWITIKSHNHDVWTRVETNDYDDTIAVLLCRYIGDSTLEYSSGSVSDERSGCLDDGYLYKWGGQITDDWTNFSIDDGDLVGIDPQVTCVSTPSIMDCGKAANYLTGDDNE